MTVIIAPTATADLADIWRWNVQQSGTAHADDDLAFPYAEIAGLANTHSTGSPVSTRPDLSYLLLRRRRSRGHAHLAVYAVTAMTVNVVHVFHTAQNWQQKLTP